MLGADGVWLGTRFVATPESGVSDAYRDRLVASSADDTVLTEVFDLVLGRPWPEGVAGRAVANRFSHRWHGHEVELHAWAAEHGDQYLALGPDAEIDDRAVWAGEAVSLVTEIETAGEVVARLVAEATAVLSSRPGAVQRGPEH